MQTGHPVYTVRGDEQNIKITYPIDLHIADKLFQLSAKSLGNDSDNSLAEKFFADRTIVVIGGTSGIGKALSGKLGGYAKKVYAIGRKTKPGIDLIDPESVEAGLAALFAAERRIDYIINCAGDLIRKNVEFTSVQEWDYVYDINVRANYLLAKASLVYFRKQNFGNLIFVGSSSYTRGRGGYSAYCSSKAALVNFTQAFAEEVRQFNVNVNIVSPSRVDTPLRYRNFGKEDKKSLLTPEYVALKIIQAMMIDTTGSIFEIS
jgi:2-C-methyl-D-erythritol 4-phosphate cytidylyltransferase